MKRTLLSKFMLLLCIFIVGGGNFLWALTKTEGFEHKEAASSYQSTVTVSTAESDCGISWEIYYGCVTTTEKMSGDKSVGLRLQYNKDIYGYLQTTTPIDGLTKVDFYAKASTAGSANILIDIKYSTDGSSWTNIETAMSLTNKFKAYSVNIPTGGKYFRIDISSTSTKPTSSYAQLSIDDVKFSTPNTVTLADTNSTLTEVSVGAGVNLPSRSNMGDYIFYGWSETEISNETTEEPENIISAGDYNPADDVTLYPVYTKGKESVTIGNYASANSWSNGTKYTTINLYKVTATVSGGANSGKYYTDGYEWRLYQTENPTLTISVSGGFTLSSVKITYNVSYTGILVYNETQYASPASINVSGTSATFSVGNSGSATNGQVKITAFEVTYGDVRYTSHPTTTISINAACNDGAGNYYSTYSNTNAFVVASDLTVSEITV